jgi:hypothetical protein
MHSALSYIRSILLILLFCFVGVSVVMFAGLTAGFVLNWTVPSIDLGIATLCGLVANATFATGLVYTLRMAGLLRSNDEMAGDLEEDDPSEPFSEEQVESMADQLTETIMMRMAVHDGWSRTKSRSRR